MEFYLIALIVLFSTALADLYVGVANDAVNFLNSAVGSKAGRRWVIMTVASAGVLVGTTFSSGMMEVARKGIFNPEMFTFHEVMIVFVAVMVTDILLLDLYNTFALPTSTTVSIVFELLGASFAMATIKVAGEGGTLGDVLRHINTERVLTIVSSIGLSIIFAFVFGVLIQFLTRLIFTFNYQKTFRRYGAIWCGAALSAITYFILVKGAKGSAVLTDDQVAWLSDNLSMILLASFIAWTAIWQAVILFTKIQVLRVIVLVGTFALALAFAANDLVNFVGAPLAALSAYQYGTSVGGDPHLIMMDVLAAPVRANAWILVLAGGIMALTLWFSRKARSVTMTEVNLGRQEEGAERFGASGLSRAVVRIGLAVFGGMKAVTPRGLQSTIAHRLDTARRKVGVGEDGKPASFDLLRAAVNLMVASALISIGTSLKLPLSTTFVTFMVAMSTSLADKSWGRESAVNRVNGVITVIGGWFFTAFMAFTASSLFAAAINYGGLPVILGLVALGFYFFFRTRKIHTAREKKQSRKEREAAMALGGASSEFVRTMERVAGFFGQSRETIDACYSALKAGQRGKLQKVVKQAGRLSEEGDEIVVGILNLMRGADDEERGAAPRYGRKIASLQIITANITSLANASFTYIANSHQPPDQDQAKEMDEVNATVAAVLKRGADMMKTQKFDGLSGLQQSVSGLKETIRQFDKRQMKRIKSGKSKTRQTLLFLGTLNKAERVADQVVNLLHFYRDSVRELGGD